MSMPRAGALALILASAWIAACGERETAVEVGLDEAGAEGVALQDAAAASTPAAPPGSDAGADAADDAAHPGEAVYAMYCGACHDGGVDRAPLLPALQAMSEQSLRFALSEGGVMAQQAALLSEEELAQVVDYLADRDDGGDWVANMMCPADRRTVELGAVPAMAVFGGDLASTRNLSASRAGLTRADIRDLELAWAVGFPQTSGMGATPAIVGSTVFTTAGGSGKVLAMDAVSGCVKWAYDGPRSRSSMTYGEIGGRPALAFSDGRGDIHALDAATGEPIWTGSGLPSRGEGASIRGAVVLAGDALLVPISASGVVAGMNPAFECCVGHGAVVALDAATGERRWEHHTMEDADYTGEVSSTGVRQRGPSGAPIWSTPTADLERGLVYVTTGENTSLPATGTSDAIIALDLATGEERWVFQALAKDVWHIGCGGDLSNPNPNCPTGEDLNSRDYDFGGSAVLAKLADGRDVLLAGQKSGDLWALDPDTGEMLWNQRVGSGTALGGNHWGIAIDGERVFLPIADPDIARVGDTPLAPGVYAFDIATGEPIWSFEASPDCAPQRQERAPGCAGQHGFSATPLVVDGALIAGTLDGRIYAFDGETGEVLHQYDTLRDYATLNGVEGRGGSIDSHALSAGAGTIFVGSGYGSFGQPAGNVLLALRPPAQQEGP